MSNSLFAALSPIEESALRVIARGSVNPKSLPESYVARLKRLHLIEETRTGLALSPLGQERLDGSMATPDPVHR